MVEITDVQAATATARILSVEESGVAVAIENIEPGLPAVMESAAVDLQRRVRFYQKVVGENEHELPAKLAAKQAVALEKVRQLI